MKYLFNLQPGTPMHYWDGDDTYCKGWDKMERHKWIETRTNPQRPVCKDCKQALANRNHSPKYRK